MKPFVVLLTLLSLTFAIQAQTNPPTVQEAQQFMDKAEAQLSELSVKVSRAQWVQANFITDDTETIASQANEDFLAAKTKLAADVKRFDGMQFPPVLDRKFKLLKLSLFSLSDPKEREEVARLGTNLEAPLHETLSDREFQVLKMIATDQNGLGGYINYPLVIAKANTTTLLQSLPNPSAPTRPTISTLAPSRAAATSVPITAIPPHLSYFIPMILSVPLSE